MKSLEELKAIKEKMQKQENGGEIDADMTRVAVGMATCGIANGARPVMNRMTNEVNNMGLDKVMVVPTGCIGLCQYEPIVEVFEPGKPKVTYIKMTADKAVEVVHQHLMNGNVIKEYTLEALEEA